VTGCDEPDGVHWESLKIGYACADPALGNFRGCGFAFAFSGVGGKQNQTPWGLLLTRAARRFLDGEAAQRA
jgi:hypothetical protein